jgi:acyl carrier protein
MVPSAWVPLNELPLTVHGKVDRERLRTDMPGPALPVPDGGPQTVLERQLVTIWSQVLGVTHVGRHDNFFDLGGHSLNATLVISRIYEQTRAAISLQQFFDAPTVGQLCAVVEHAMSAGPPEISRATALRRKRDRRSGGSLIG